MITQRDFKTLADKANSIYSGGCYLLSLLKALKPELFSSTGRLLFTYDELLAKGYIDADCYVRDPEAICRYFGRHYHIEKSYVYKPGAIVIACWTSREYSHFVLMHSETKVRWDPLVDSSTVANGHISSWRIFS